MRNRTMAAVIAEERTIKSRVDRAVTDAFKDLQSATKTVGHMKTYRPVKEQNEDGSPVEVFPPEVQKVQTTAAGALKAIQDQLNDLFRVTEEKDRNNAYHVADVVLDGCVMLKAVPVPHLIWLEKQLVLLKSVIDKMPVLDPSEVWTYDHGEGLYVSQPVERARTEKVQKPVVLYHATDKHPAQTQMVQGETTVGYWKHVKLSGAMPRNEVMALGVRIDKAIRAVKTARADANSGLVTQSAPAESPLLAYVFQGELVVGE